MIAKTRRTGAALLSLLTALAAVSALVLAVPVGAQTRAQPLQDRVADLCAASDVDLVGKRIARECRQALRAEKHDERLASTRRSDGTRVALRK